MLQSHIDVINLSYYDNKKQLRDVIVYILPLFFFFAIIFVVLCLFSCPRASQGLVVLSLWHEDGFRRPDWEGDPGLHQLRVVVIYAVSSWMHFFKFIFFCATKDCKMPIPCLCRLLEHNIALGGRFAWTAMVCSPL